MNTIWKHPLDIGRNSIRLSAGAIIVLVATDPSGVLCLWATHDDDPGASVSPENIVVVGTGHPAPTDMAHVGSCLQGMFVWHVFQEAGR